MAEAKVASYTDRAGGKVILTVEYEEAQRLRALLQRIGGHPETTPRGTFDAIDEALEEAGVAPSFTTHFKGYIRAIEDDSYDMDAAQDYYESRRDD